MNATAKNRPVHIVFSVGAIPGFKSVKRDHGISDVVQTERAIDAQHPERALENVRVVVPRSEFYGGASSKDFISEVLHNPTWAQIKGVAARAARQTGDLHHVYLEGVNWTGRKHTDGTDIITLAMGS